MLELISSARALTNALDDACGAEHSSSKTIRRYLDRFNGSPAEMAAKFRSLIDHEDGLLNSIDNELIQICHAQNDKEHEHDRVQMCIAIITTKTTFVKNVILVSTQTAFAAE